MAETIAEPRADLKEHAPRIETMTIPKEFIGAVIGPGGKIIQGMQEETGPIAMPDTGFLIFTPASINANVPAHTVAIEEEPLDSRISETTRTTYG